MTPGRLAGWRAVAQTESAEAIWLFPAVMVGMVLPLDFLYQVEGYRMYLRPLAIARLFAYATVLYVCLALVTTWLLLIAAWLAVRLTHWPRILVFRTIFGGISSATAVLILMRSMKLWSPGINAAWGTFDHKWSLMVTVTGVCALAAFLKRGGFSGLLRWAAVSSALVLSAAAASSLIGALTHSAEVGTERAPAGARRTPSGPNIILVTIDTFAAGHSSLYHYRQDTTPALARLALEASTFDNFYANSNETVPSVNSMFYGVRPWTHRAFALGDPISARSGLVAQLKREGYTTLAVTSNPYASPRQKFTEQYFDESVDCAVRWSLCLLFRLAPADSLPVARLTVVSRLTAAIDVMMVRMGIWSSTDHFDPELVLSRARQMLTERRSGGPLFLWVHLFPPHAPYAAPAPFIGHFDPGAPRRTRFDSIAPMQFLAGDDPTFPDAYVGRYDESLQYVDDHVGRFVDWLKEQGLYDESLIMLTADHGESFSRGYGQHGGPLLHNELIHVPLLIKQPYQTEGRRIDALAEQVDLEPTILDLTGVGVPETLEGTSLSSALRGEAQAPAHAIWSMNFELNSRFKPLSTGTVSMIADRWKYVAYLGYEPSALRPGLHDELYDLAEDPGEVHNLLELRADKAATMREAIEAQLRRHLQLPE